NRAVLSADGTKVGYSVRMPNSTLEIGVVNFDGTGRRALVTNLDPGPTLSISGDGSRLLAGGSGRLYATDGSGVVQLALLEVTSNAPLISDTLNRATMNSASSRVLHQAPD